MYLTYPKIEEWNKKYKAYEMQYAREDSRYEWDEISPEDVIDEFVHRPRYFFINREDTPCYVTITDEEAFEGFAIPISLYEEILKDDNWNCIMGERKYV